MEILIPVGIKLYSKKREDKRLILEMGKLWDTRVIKCKINVEGTENNIGVKQK